MVAVNRSPSLCAPLAWACPSLRSSDDAVRPPQSHTPERGYQLRRPGHRPRSYRDRSERSLPRRQRSDLLAPARHGVADHRPRTQAGYGVRPRRRDHRPPARVGVPPLAATGRGPYAGRPGPTRGRGGAARRRHAGDPRPRLRPVPPGPPPHARADGLTTLLPRHHDDRDRARDDLRDPTNELHVVRMLRRIPHRNRHLRPRPRLGVARHEECAPPRAHLPVGIAHAYLTLVRRVGEPARRTDVVLDPAALLPQH